MVCIIHEKLYEMWKRDSICVLIGYIQVGALFCVEVLFKYPYTIHVLLHEYEGLV